MKNAGAKKLLLPCRNATRGKETTWPSKWMGVPVMLLGKHVEIKFPVTWVPLLWKCALGSQILCSSSCVPVGGTQLEINLTEGGRALFSKRMSCALHSLPLPLPFLFSLPAFTYLAAVNPFVCFFSSFSAGRHITCSTRVNLLIGDHRWKTWSEV